MIPLNSNANVDNSDLINFPDGRIKDNDGSGNGTGVNRSVYGDLHSNISKLMRLYGITPTGLPDNETNGYQIIQALQALASKNDFIYPLTTDGTFLNVGIKLSSMLTNEFLVCLAGSDLGTETQIKGIGVGTFTVTYSGSFKANEYVRVIKTSSGISIIRIADWNSLSAMCIDAGFLKAATQTQENTGTSNSVATTPLTNLTAFVRRVTGVDSGSYLATGSTNGLYPKEHFAIVAGIGASPIKNTGWFSGFDIGVSVPFPGLPVGGDITRAISTSPSSGDGCVTVTMTNAMANTNFIVKCWLKSESTSGAGGNNDNDVGCPVFRPITGSLTTFELWFREIAANTQNLKVFIEVVQL